MRVARSRVRRPVVVSIFVNPTQFGPPRTSPATPGPSTPTASCARRQGIDLIVAPTVDEMYPPESRTVVEVAKLEDALAGAIPAGPLPWRGHGCAQAVPHRPADSRYFGQKDAQQALIIRRMVADLNLAARDRRRPDGARAGRAGDVAATATSTRPSAPRDRRLYRALRAAEEPLPAAATPLALPRRPSWRRAGRRVDYLASPARTSAPSRRRTPGHRGPVLVAARVGTTRLIDNLPLVLGAAGGATTAR